MDVLAIIGAIVAFGAILLGNQLEGGQLTALIDGPAALIVIGGTLGAVVLRTPGAVIRRTLQVVKWVVAPPGVQVEQELRRLTEWSRIARREGLLGLENRIESVKDPLRRKGLELLVDGVAPASIRRVMENDREAKADNDLSAASVFRSMGGYAPTIGILGAVIGLIQVLGNLADPDELGQGIATAFVATIYGVGLANLLFLPVAERLKDVVLSIHRLDGVFIEGLIAIAEGEHPRSIEVRLSRALAA